MLSPLSSALASLRFGVTTSASADMIDVAGSSTSLIIAGNKFNDFSLYRSTAPTATASGISLSFTRAGKDALAHGELKSTASGLKILFTESMPSMQTS